ncbi:MAG: hypothetical protein MR270_06070, partial [Erysipelotrichaceae bacterium]|nr:hypothetical protein [Erysipelotrichaceae bacterium]
DYKLYYFGDEVLYESKDKVNYNDFIHKDSNDETQTLNLFVMYDYGMHEEGQVTTLLDGNLIWFNPKDYGIDTLVAGDELVIKYTGEYEVQETYPGSVNVDKMTIQSIEVIEADIVEFTVSAVPGSDELNLVPVDSKYNNYKLLNEGYVVSQDETFKKYDEYPENTILYASLPKTTGSIRVDGLYDYNPREKIIPTGQYQLSIIDSGNYIVDELSHDAGMYTPGTKLEFYSHPIMDVDLAMYVNDEFYDIQYSIKVNDRYMWKYTFVMPAEDVVIKFYIHSIEYTDVRNALNLPELSYKDIVEVRYERGYIGVAPGMLTNITYSSDMEDKNKVMSLLEMTVYEDASDNWQVTGGGYTLYSIFTNDQRYDIEITNGYISNNQKHYKFVGEYVSFEYPKLETHGFVSYQETAEVWWNETFICEIPMDELEFKQVDSYVSTEGGIVGDWIVKTEFGDLYFPEPKIFENLNTYELTGLSLFKLVEKYSNWWISPNGQPVQIEE